MGCYLKKKCKDFFFLDEYVRCIFRVDVIIDEILVWVRIKKSMIKDLEKC